MFLDKVKVSFFKSIAYRIKNEPQNALFVDESFQYAKTVNFAIFFAVPEYPLRNCSVRVLPAERVDDVARPVDFQFSETDILDYL